MEEMAMGDHGIGLNHMVDVMCMNSKSYSHEHVLGAFNDFLTKAQEICSLKGFQ